jgi:cellobiose dehydrogenase (acceptor)|tara:strand:- start:6131 stop:6523 length:393 start_codon:yes stop_codon:yes gene_type:complete
VSPYFNDAGGHDFDAVLTSSASLLSLINTTMLQTIPDSFIIYPPPELTLEQYLRAQTPPSSNHWVGTAKMAANCKEEGAVVDTSTLVCGMKNLHVVDASILNGNPAANPQATFIVMAEKAAEVINGLGRW